MLKICPIHNTQSHFADVCYLFLWRCITGNVHGSKETSECIFVLLAVILLSSGNSPSYKRDWDQDVIHRLTQGLCLCSRMQYILWQKLNYFARNVCEGQQWWKADIGNISRTLAVIELLGKTVIGNQLKDIFQSIYQTNLLFYSVILSFMRLLHRAIKDITSSETFVANGIH